MTWEEMIQKLRTGGVKPELLPVRGSSESCYGLRRDGDRFVVSLMERGKVQDLAEFPSEEMATAFIYDDCVFAFRLHGDTRFDRWNADRKNNPLPTAEKFGGHTLRRQ